MNDASCGDDVGHVAGDHGQENKYSRDSEEGHPLFGKMRVPAVSEDDPDGDSQDDETESADEENVQRTDAVVRPDCFDRESDHHRRQTEAQTIAQEASAAPSRAKRDVNQDRARPQPGGGC